jgi:hypothetical protein
VLQNIEADYAVRPKIGQFAEGLVAGTGYASVQVRPAGKVLGKTADAGGFMVDGNHRLPIEQRLGEIPDAASDLQNALAEFG